jgi:hypothetical protein
MEETNQNNYNQLTIEQEFRLSVFTQEIQNLSQEQAQEFLVEMFRQMMVKENIIRTLFKDTTFTGI